MSAHAKLNDDATGTGENLDQVLYFGLQEQILEICKQRSDQFSEYGVTLLDVLEEIRCVLESDNETILKDNQLSQTGKESQ